MGLLGEVTIGQMNCNPDMYDAQDKLSSEHIIQYYVHKTAWLKFKKKSKHRRLDNIKMKSFKKGCCGVNWIEPNDINTN